MFNVSSQAVKVLVEKKQEVKAYAAHVASVNKKLKSNLLEGLDSVRWKDFVKNDSVVFVKPNFTFPFYQKGITTSPELLRYLLEILKDRCVNVVLGESDGGNYSFRAEEAFAGHQMNEICKEVGAELVNLSRLPSRFIESEIQSRKVKVQLPNMLLEKVDCFISVPVLKVHVMTGVSLAIKNLWGCYPDTMRLLFHQNLDRKLSLIAELLNPKIAIIDGIYGLDGHGPLYGNPIRMDLTLFSNNIVVADSLGAMIMGVPLEKAKHILIAEKEGIGTTNLENVEINADWSEYRREFQTRKTFLDRASRLVFNSQIAARLVFASPITPIIYKAVGTFRSSEEQVVASQLNAHNYQM